MIFLVKGIPLLLIDILILCRFDGLVFHCILFRVVLVLRVVLFEGVHILHGFDRFIVEIGLRFGDRWLDYQWFITIIN